jgi:hypothetical protein
MNALLLIWRRWRWRHFITPGTSYNRGAFAVLVGDGTRTVWMLRRPYLTITAMSYEGGQPLDFSISGYERHGFVDDTYDSPGFLNYEIYAPLRFGQRALVTWTPLT